MSDVFISYAHLDRSVVDQLSQDLSGAGYSTWYDQHIQPAMRFRREIVDNIWRCHVMLVVLSEAALQSEWVRFECGLGYALGKIMLVVNTNVEHVRMQDLPDFLKDIEVLQPKGPSLSEEIVNALGKMDLPPRFWSAFSDNGIDICLPTEVFQKAGDRATADIEGINLRTINAALDLQQQLQQRFGLISRDGELTGIRFLPDHWTELPPERNYLILGGPGGVPFVRTLLSKWSGLTQTDTLESGYRFVTDPRRYFVSGHYLRRAESSGMFSRHIGPLGIEDVQAGKASHFYEFKDASMAASGRNYVIVYTGGLDKAAAGGSKFVVLAAFNRHVLDGAFAFLLNRRANNRWLAQIQKCGPHTETLVEFEVNVGHAPTIREVHRPRTLGR